MDELRERTETDQPLGYPDQIRFRYRLVENGDEEWISAGAERTATFTHLSAGSYRFEVAAELASNQLPPETATLAFTIRAAWWETEWFRIGAVLAGSLGLGFLVRFVVKRRMRARMLRLTQKHALERERTRIARDIHDELGANLTQITFATQLAKMGPPESVSGHINQIAALARGTVDSLDEIVWAINPRCDHLSALVEYMGKFAVNFLDASGIKCRLELPQDLPAWPMNSAARHHLFMGVKEALNNAAKYSGATLVQIKATLEGTLFRIEIFDHGCGFEIKNVDADGNGLKNMRERLSEVGGACGIESSPGQGTRITFALPLSTNHAKPEK